MSQVDEKARDKVLKSYQHALDNGYSPRAAMDGALREYFHITTLEAAKPPAPEPAPSPAAVQGSGATVKPIDWRDMTYKGVEEWLGHCALSQSFTIKDEDPLHEGSEYRFVVRPILSGRTSFPTADEAKAAAQADYEQRIRSALSPAPTGCSNAK